MCFRLSARHMDSLAAESQKSDHQAGGTQYGASEMSEASSFRVSGATESTRPILHSFEFRSLARTFACGGWLFSRFRTRFFGPHRLNLFTLVRSLLFLSLFLVWHGGSPLALSSSPVSFFRKKFS